MAKDQILGIIIMVLSPFEFIPLIIYFFRYIEEYSYRTLMDHLGDELGKTDLDSKEKDRIRYAFEAVFHRYSDSTGVGSLGLAFVSFAINTVIFALIIVMLILQCHCVCKKDIVIKTIWSIIMLVIAFAIAIIYDVSGFNVKYIIDLRDDEIYRFSDQFNQEIKKNLDDVYNRRKDMITCAFLVQSVMIIQIVLIILKCKFTDETKDAQINFAPYPLYVPNALNAPNSLNVPNTQIAPNTQIVPNTLTAPSAPNAPINQENMYGM